MSDNSENTYIACAERIIGYCLNNQSAIDGLRDRLPDSVLFPTRDNLAATWETVLAQDTDGVRISPESIADATGGNLDRLTSLLYSEADTSDAEIETLVEILIKRGKTSAKRRIGHELRQGEIDGAEAIERLEAIDNYGYTERDTTAAALVDGFEEEIAKEPAQANPTGIGPIDVALWDMPVGKSTIVAAEYKGYKSRVLRNLILASASRGSRCFVVLAEGWVEEFTRECLAMIANLYLIRNGYWNSDKNQPYLTGEYLARSRAYLKNNVHAEALRVAKAVFRSLPIRVIDGTDGANDPSSVISKARQEARRGTTLIAIDYIQNVDFSGKEIYNQMVTARKWLRKLRSLERHTPKKGVHVLIMSQKNEESIKSQGKNSGVKGGGELPQETDALLAPSHDDDLDEERYPDESWRGVLKLPLRFSRVNRPMRMEFEVEINSGVLLSYTHTSASGTQTVVPVDVIPASMLTAQKSFLPPEPDDLI